MTRTMAQTETVVEWGVASRPIAGQTVSGDLHLVKPLEHGVLLAAIDGVGHGAEAAAAARVAAAVLENYSHEPVISLIKRCHGALARTRGVVMTLGSLNALDDKLTWLGVGNVEGLLLRAGSRAVRPSEHVLLRSGLVGYQLPALQASVLPVAPGDLLLLATDGVRSNFTIETSSTAPAADLAERILRRHFKGTDDALVLVARYLGIRHEE